MASEVMEPVGWYISQQNGNSMGPLNDAEMRQAIGRGRVKPDDHVWREGMDGWVEAREIPNFDEVRRTFKPAIERPRRQMPHAGKRQTPPPAGQKRRSTRDRVPPGSQTPPPADTTGPLDSSGSSPSKPSPQASLEDWLRKLGKGLGKGKAGGELPAELEQKLKAATAKIGKIPPGAIAFLVLGMFVTPLLPIFWFIAWRIWAKANR